MPFANGNQSGHGRHGKIRVLPPEIRDEVNRRIERGERASDIAAWLNSDPAVREIMDKEWRGQSISKQAVWSWRRTGYQDWLRRSERLQNLRDLSEQALKLGQVLGGNIADGSAAIAGGRILAELENAAGDDLHKAIRSIAQLRHGDVQKVRLEHSREKLELERKRYQRQTAEIFLEWYKDKRAQDIIDSRDGNAERIERIGRLMFGEAW